MPISTAKRQRSAIRNQEVINTVIVRHLQSALGDIMQEDCDEISDQFIT